MCRAHGIPHQRVTDCSGLDSALSAAWGLNRHSVVEVITDRIKNVRVHKYIQARVQAAVQQCFNLVTVVPSSPEYLNRTLVASATQGEPLTGAATTQLPPGAASTQPSTSAASTQPYTGAASTQLPPSAASTQLPSGGQAAAQLCPTLTVASAGCQQFSLPMVRPLTTSASGGRDTRQGLYIRIQLEEDDRSTACGVGEVSPLPGLHSETLEQAAAQAAAVMALMQGVQVPREIALLGGRLGRFGIESALLGAIASARSCSMSELLGPQNQSSRVSPSDPSPALGQTDPSPCVSINGLVSAATLEEAVSQAKYLVLEQGFLALKIKVARRSPEEDAEVVAAIRIAVGEAVQLRADANRGWSLDEAVRFGQAVQGCNIAFVEEPTQDPFDMPEFFRRTGVRVAVDESLDDGSFSVVGPHRGALSASLLNSQGQHLELVASTGLAALVVKPSKLGSYEIVEALAAWAHNEAVQVIISSSFESSAGIAILCELASAVDQGMGHSRAPIQILNQGQSQGSSRPIPASGARSMSLASGAVGCMPVSHGLGTLSWFLDADTPRQSTDETGQPSSSSSASSSGCSQSGGTTSSVTESRCTESRSSESKRTESRSTESTSTESSSTNSSQGSASASSKTPEPNATRANNSSSSASHSSGLEARREGGDANGNRPGAWGGGSTTGVHSQKHLQRLLTDSGKTVTCAEMGQHALRAGSEQYKNPNTGDAGVRSSNPYCGDIKVLSFQRSVHVAGVEYTFQVLEVAGTQAEGTGAKSVPKPPVVFLHGFLGCGGDWRPVMDGMAAAGHRCIAIDLPGHGDTSLISPGSSGSSSDQIRSDQISEEYGLPCTAAAIQALCGELGLQGAVLVGYSLGARLALSMALSSSQTFSSLVMVSGTAGIEDKAAASARAAADDALASHLVTSRDLPLFLESWYSTLMWAPLRRHPRFRELLQRRGVKGDQKLLATALKATSTGRMESMWHQLQDLDMPLLLVTGAQDVKFNAIARRMMRTLSPGIMSRDEFGNSGGGGAQHVVLPACGHAVPSEKPLLLLRTLLASIYSSEICGKQ
eukprot:gene27191-2435_t